VNAARLVEAVQLTLRYTMHSAICILPVEDSVYITVY
jgi:hypothetical protein